MSQIKMVQSDVDTAIFLDIDGVLRPPGPCNGKLSRRRVKQLIALCRALDAKIIISSTWRWNWSQAQFNTLLDDRVIGVTPDLAPHEMGPFQRWDEIQGWLSRNGTPRRWLAIDDDADGFPPRCKHVHLTDPQAGLTREAAIQIARRLQSA